MRKFLILFVVLFAACDSSVLYTSLTGGVYGTIYHIKYRSNSVNPELLQNNIEAEMDKVNSSLSMFNKNSTIALLNSNATDEVDSLFMFMYRKAMMVNKMTRGAFDITVAPLVDAWGFGVDSESMPTQTKIDSILQFVGMDKIDVVDGKLIKSDPRMKIDASSIAKGLGVDLVANYLEKEGINNYIVEIGGEIRAKGINASNTVWRVGLDKPIVDKSLSNRQLQMILNLKDGALATSGNYRNFIESGGKRYGHIINPTTGESQQRDILSATVYAKDCMTADAYATAFMVLGLEESQKLLKNIKDIEVCFIYDSSEGHKLWKSKGFNSLLLKK